MDRELRLRGSQQECSHNPYEISTLHPKLGLRDVPGKLIQGRGQTKRFRSGSNPHPRLNTASCKVIRIRRAPGRLLLLPTQGLALRLIASPLAGASSIIGTVPAMADATRTLPGNRHDASSSLRPAHLQSSVQTRWVTFGEQTLVTSRKR